MLEVTVAVAVDELFFVTLSFHRLLFLLNRDGVESGKILTFYENGKSWSVGINKKNIFPKDKKFYYISVNDAITKQLKSIKML